MVEMIAMEKLSAAANVVPVLLKKLRQEDGVVEDGVMDERALVDVVARGRREDPAHDS